MDVKIGRWTFVGKFTKQIHFEFKILHNKFTYKCPIWPMSIFWCPFQRLLAFLALSPELYPTSRQSTWIRWWGRNSRGRCCNPPPNRIRGCRSCPKAGMSWIRGSRRDLDSTNELHIGFWSVSSAGKECWSASKTGRGFRSAILASKYQLWRLQHRK